MLNQRPARTRPQVGVEDGRSHSADNLMEGILGTSEKGRAGGKKRSSMKPKEWRNEVRPEE